MRRIPTMAVAVVMLSACSTPVDEPATTLASAPQTTSIQSTTTATSTTTSTTTTSTTAPETTTTLARVVDLAEGLLCRDLNEMGHGYEDAVAYWVREGRPDRMDADSNGIPCETVYPPAAVTAFWGDPLPTTTVAGPVYLVVDPWTFPSPPAEGEASGSGCAPGPGPLPDGVWFGYPAERNADSIGFDLACLWIVPESDAGYEITNTNPTLRTVPVAAGAVVYHLTGSFDYTALPYGDWFGIACGLEPIGCPVWLYVNGGRVTEVVEQYFP